MFYENVKEGEAGLSALIVVIHAVLRESSMV